jgi:hypothetical protein
MEPTRHRLSKLDKLLRRIPTKTMVTLSLVALLALGHTAAPAASQEQTLRLLQWNIWMIPDPLAEEHNGTLDNDDRVPHVAARLNSGNYDVVTLNELFSGAQLQKGPQDELIYLLTRQGPDGPWDQEMEDLYDTLKPDSYTPAIADPGQFSYYVWMPGFYWDFSGDAGLAVFTKFPPKPRKDMMTNYIAPVIPQNSPSQSQIPAPPFYCLGSGAQKFLEAQLPFPSSDYLDPWWLASSGFETSGDHECAAAFSPYQYAGGDDKLASKGIGWVRVYNSKTSRPLNIFFTHTQADYPENNPPENYSSVREQQIKQLIEFIEYMAPSKRDEDVLLMGDLNILGDGGNYLQPYGAWDGSEVQNPYEYSQVIDPGLLHQVGFDDLFRAHLKPIDHDGGFTRHPVWNTETGSDPYAQRLDYILARWSSKPIHDAFYPCPEHLRARRDFNLLPGSSGQPDTDISDHFAVEAVVGIDRPGCSPFQASVNPAPGIKYVDILDTGGYYWLRFPAYTDIMVAGDPIKDANGNVIGRVRADAFAAHDISMPLAPFDGSPLLLTEGSRDLEAAVVYYYPFDYYVRVSADLPNWTGTLRIKLIKPDGKTFDTALPVLTTGIPDDSSNYWSDSYTRPIQFVGSNNPNQYGQTAIWLRLGEVEMPDMSDPTKQCFHLGIAQGHAFPFGGASPKAYKWDVWSADHTLVTPAGSWRSTQSPDYYLEATCEDGFMAGVTKPGTGYRLRLYRPAQGSQDLEELRVGLSTNLRGFLLKGISIVSGWDDGAATGDELVPELDLDGATVVMQAPEVEPGGSATGFTWCNDPHPADQRHMHFLDHLTWSIGENDSQVICTVDGWTDEYWVVGRTGAGVSPAWLYHGSSTLHPTGELPFTSAASSYEMTWDYNVPDDARYLLHATVYIPGGVAPQPE